MTTVLGQFNEQIVAFLTELCAMFPEEKQLSVALNAVCFVKRTNPREILNQFKTHVYPYKEVILARNEGFFLGLELDDLPKEQMEQIRSITRMDNSNIMTHILRIKDIWQSGRLSKGDKDAIWAYFRVFFHLADKEIAQRR